MKEKFSAINTASDVRSLLLFSDLNGENPEEIRKRILAGFEVEPVKQNPKRKVYRLSCPDGRELYLKLFARQNALVSCWRFYAFREYQSARRLELLNLPVIRYLAWGRLRKGGGFCLSEGIPEAVPARRYCFETLPLHPERQAAFLEQLAAVVFSLRRSRVRHPDLHLGNILYSARTDQLYLADPWGVRPVWFWRQKHQLELCLPWLELQGSIPDAGLLQGIQESGLADSLQEAGDLLRKAARRHAQYIRKHRSKLSARILSGKSKFATEVVLPEGTCSFRHTEWFDPPENMTLNPEWRKTVFRTEQESRKIWLDSFLQIPPAKNPPIARLVCPDGSSVLFYPDGKN